MSTIYHLYYLEKLGIIKSIKKQVTNSMTIAFVYDGVCALIDQVLLLKKRNYQKLLYIYYLTLSKLRFFFQLNII